MNPTPGQSGQASNLKAQAKEAAAALKNEDYGEAIALIEPLLEQPLKPSTEAHLRRNLAKAYMGLDNALAAFHQCDYLRRNPDPDVRKWGKKAINHLRKKYPYIENSATPIPTSMPTGFTPLNPSPSPSPRPSHTADVFANSLQEDTGFTPFIPSSAPANESRPTPSSTTKPYSTQSTTINPPGAPLPSQSTPLNNNTDIDDDHNVGLDFKPQSTPASPDSIASPASTRDEMRGYADALDSSMPNGLYPANEDVTSSAPIASPASSAPVASPASSAPIASPAPASAPATIQTFPWTNADRAKRWSPIRIKPTFASRVNTVLVHGWTAIALWIVAKSFLQIGMVLGNPLRDQVERFIPFQRWFFLEYYPGRVAGVVLVALLILSPWILDLFLKWGHKAKSLSMDDLDRHSPEAKKILQQASRKQKHPVPTLKLLPTQTPVIMSYGLRPRFSRIVMSEGLLRQLDEEELAALVGAEVGHIQAWNLAVISLVTLSAQVSYGLYQLFSDWADGRDNAFLQWVGAAFAAIAYGMFWLVRSTGLWLSRSRFEHSDRAAANLTGHPNALTRALMKLTIATATDIRRQGHTAPVLEQFEWLMPVGYRTAISTGSVFPLQYQSPANAPTPQHPNNPTILDWDYRNPHRSWLSINTTHPPLGDRLYRLAQYAKKWKVTSEFDLPTDSRIAASPHMKIQVAPFIGFFVGAALTVILWLVGMLADQFNWRALEWLQYDSQAIFQGMLALGFSFGTILRFNAFFPDIKPSTRRQEDLPALLNQPEEIPASGQPVQLEGKLLGRRGTGNWLNQDLILQTQAGLVRLHCISMVGAVGNLIFDAMRLQPLKGRTVMVTGWLRRGATPWMDVETIKSQRGKTIQAGHPIWSMLLAAAAALWGAYSLY